MADDKQMAQLKVGLKQKLMGRLQDRLKIQKDTGVSIGGRQTLGNIVEQITEELQSQEAQCRYQQEMDAAGLFRLLREKVLPVVVKDIQGGLAD